MRIVDAPGFRAHVTVIYGDLASRYSFPLRGGPRRLWRYCVGALIDAREALQIPHGEPPFTKRCDAILTLGVDPTPLPEGVAEVLL